MLGIQFSWTKIANLSDPGIRWIPLAAAAILLTGCATELAPAGSEVSAVTEQAPSPNSPEGGDFVAFLEAGEADPSLLELRVLYPQVNQRVQVILQNEDGSEEQLYFLQITRSDLSSGGEYLKGPEYFEEMQLQPGRNFVQILVDGQVFFGPSVFEVAEPIKEAPKQAAGGGASAPRACTEAELGIVSGAILWGYVAMVGNLIGEEGHYAEFVNRMNGDLGATNSSKVKTVLRDAIAWADGGLFEDSRYYAYQSKGEKILNTREC